MIFAHINMITVGIEFIINTQIVIKFQPQADPPLAEIRLVIGSIIKVQDEGIIKAQTMNLGLTNILIYVSLSAIAG